MRKADDAFDRLRRRDGQDRRCCARPSGRNGRRVVSKVKSIRELAESFNKKSAAVMEEGRRSLLDISQAAIKVTRKFDAASGRRR